MKKIDINLARLILLGIVTFIFLPLCVVMIAVNIYSHEIYKPKIGSVYKLVCDYPFGGDVFYIKPIAISNGVVLSKNCCSRDCLVFQSTDRTYTYFNSFELVTKANEIPQELLK